MAANIVITGFMGTGKSSVGQLVAGKLGRRFVDMDLAIEAREGRTIGQIFSDEGEAYFRALERELCRELAAQSDLVVATGGGALINPVNRQIMSRTGMLFCLNCEAEEIIRRLAQTEDRPLLDVDDRQKTIEALLAQRQEAYSRIFYQVEATTRTAEQVAEEVVRLSKVFRRLPVEAPTGPYAIHLALGGLGAIADLLSEWGQPSGVAVVSNSTVWSLHGGTVESSLRREGFDPTICLVPDGEAHKRLDTVRQLYDRFIDGALDRSSLVIAVGGGVVGDMAGFAAATYMRGVPLVQVPTSLLAMVDSSVGGKVAVDHPRGKNLIGAFKQPVFVVMDPEVLASLPEDELRSGWAEIIKHGILGDVALFERLEARPELRPAPEDFANIIADAVQVKIDVVEEDPYEQGRRRLLNLGHTFGHAFEVLSDYQLRHGYAVSIGMVVAAHVAQAMALCSAELPARIETILRAFGLPVRVPPTDPRQVWQAMSMDKKKRGSRLRFVLPRRLGDAITTDEVTQDTVMAVLEKLGR